MIYIVGLVDCGVCKHKWHFTDYPDALQQLNCLIRVYDEVNDIQPVLLKVGSSECNLPLDTLLKQYSIR